MGGADEADLQEVLAAVGDVIDLIERHDGEGAEGVTARIRRSCAQLSSGDLDSLKTLLAETTGGMGSLNDYGFGTDVDDRVRRRKYAMTVLAAEKCRAALRRRGVEPWR